MSMLLLISLAGKGQTLQAVTDSGNTTTKNIWIGALPSSGVIENTLNLGGRLKLLGANAAYATGVEGEQPTIYRTGVNSLGYPFNGYNNLVLQTSTQNRDMLFVTGIRTKSFIDLSGFISTSASNDPAVMDRSMNITMGTNGVERLRITTEGNIGIGTKKTGGHKLAVEGTIGARKLIVSQSTWADFVFHPSYTLPALQEVETFIKEHQHLPGIPSEAVIKAEGLDVGDMNKKLLQKVEELTLYMIDMQKRQALLETENNELKGRIKHLENRE